MIVAHVVRQESLQVLRIEHDHMIEQVSSTASHPAFGDTVLPRAPESGPKRLAPECLHRLDYFETGLRITIEDQIFVRGVVGEGFAQLLYDPTAGWHPRHVEVQNAPTIVRDDKEAVQHSEAEGGNRKEVHRCNQLSVIAQESQPALRGLRIPRRLLYQRETVRSESSKPSILQLAMNARGIPCRVLREHTKNEFSHFPADALPASPDLMPRKPRPVESKSSAVPAHHGFWCDHNQDPFPAAPRAKDDSPEQLILHTESRPRMSRAQHG
jgi:hypothetical protein